MSAVRRALQAILWAALLAPLGMDTAEAQVSILPRQGLTFGELLPGVPSQVTVLDAARRAELEIVGSGDVILTASLPTALVSPGGELVPVVFGPGTAQIRLLKGSQSQDFDPSVPLAFRIPPGQGGAYLWIGGTALPAPAQATGVYQAQIIIQIITAGT